MANAQKVLATSAIVAVGVGTANSFIKYKRPPSSRFLIGSGLAFFTLSVLAQADEDLAKAFGIAIAATVVLGQGDGLFSYVNKYGEANTQAGATDPKVAMTESARTRQSDPQHALGWQESGQRPSLVTPLPARPGLIPR